jgi:hypothetical protein
MGFISAVNGYVEEIPWKEFVGISTVNFFFYCGHGDRESIPSYSLAKTAVDVDSTCKL